MRSAASRLSIVVTGTVGSGGVFVSSPIRKHNCVSRALWTTANRSVDGNKLLSTIRLLSSRLEFGTRKTRKCAFVTQEHLFRNHRSHESQRNVFILVFVLVFVLSRRCASACFVLTQGVGVSRSRLPVSWFRAPTNGQACNPPTQGTTLSV